ncbi:MAG: OmpA family protein [Granulosicoccus sp.]
MKTINLVCHWFLVLLLVGLTGVAHAVNRNDVFAELANLNDNWNDLSLSVWINDFKDEPYPGVLVGDRITYHVQSNNPVFFVFIFVDSKGNTAILKPDALPASGITGAAENLTFPVIGENDFSQGFIEQAEPLGKETIFLVATDQKIPANELGLDAFTDYASFGNDIGTIKDIVSRFNSYTNTVKLSFVRYEYFVDSDTQFSTRGIRREISERIEEVVAISPVQIPQAQALESAPELTSSPLVINDINFEYDSDVLTATGRSQLEVLGSELLDRQEQNELPRVRLTGHTDSVGPEVYNMELSKRRSIASKLFLVEELGVPADYIDINGMGESEPIMANNSAKGRARNRRVEFEIVQ